ncbi:MAG: glycosyltransferase, partial [Pirellulales bacterium]
MRPRAGRLINESTSLADVIVACTDADGSAWRAVAGDTPVAIVPNAADIAGWQTCRTAPSDKDTFVLFGSLNQESTRAASMRFLDTVWPAYADTRPGTSLIVAGRNPGNSLIAAARAAPRVEVVANPADLIPVVARAGTVVVPQVWGTGSKLKMVEALASGRRIVASPAATVGLPDLLASHVDIAEGADEWHRLMESAVAAPRTVDQMSHLVELLSDTMSWTTSQRALITAVDTVTDP